MKVTHYLPLAAACLMMVGCGTGKQKAEMTAGIQLANLDTTALPGSSFYQYACGGWIESHPLSPEYSQYGSFTELAENNRKQIQGLIEELAATQHEAGSVAQKVPPAGSGLRDRKPGVAAAGLLAAAHPRPESLGLGRGLSGRIPAGAVRHCASVP